MLTYCSGLDMLTCCSVIDLLTYCSGSDMLTCCNVQGYTVYDHLFFRVKYAHLFFRVIYIYMLPYCYYSGAISWIGWYSATGLGFPGGVRHAARETTEIPATISNDSSLFNEPYQPFAWMIICDTGRTYLKHVSYYIIHTHTYLQSQNNRWQNRKEYKGKTNWAQSLLVFTLAVVPARQHPQSTYVPHAQPVVGNGGGRRVRHGITGLAPLPLDSTLQGILHCGNPTLRKWRRRHRTFLFCHL